MPTDTRTETATIRYLPVQAAGHRFAILMADVLLVDHLDVTEAIQTAHINPQADIEQIEAGHHISLLDLRAIFGTEFTTDIPAAYSIVVATPAGYGAALVDAVFPVQSATPEAFHPLPILVALTRPLFSGVIRVAEQPLLLVIDAPKLLTHPRPV